MVIITKSISDTLVWYILLIDMKTMAQCFHTFRCNYLLTSSVRKTLTWTCVPCWILSHCFGYKMCCMDKQKGYMQWACTGTLLRITNQSPRLLSKVLTAVSLGVDMVVPGEVWVLCWLENVGYFQSEQQDKILAYWFTLGNKSQLLNTWDSGSYWF